MQLSNRLNRSESQGRTRERLLDAARVLYARQGYGGVAIDAIAEEAGHSKGAFYSNFDSKGEIFLELLARHKAAELDGIRRLLDQAGEDVTALIVALDTWLSQLQADADPDLDADLDWSLLSVELGLEARRNVSFALRYAALQEDYRAALSAALARLFATLGRGPPPAEAATILIAMTHGLALHSAPPEGMGQTMRVALEALLESTPAA